MRRPRGLTALAGATVFFALSAYLRPQLAASATTLPAPQLQTGHATTHRLTGEALGLPLPAGTPTPLAPPVADLGDIDLPQGTADPRLESTLSQLVSAQERGDDVARVAQWRGVPLLGDELTAVVEVEPGMLNEIATAARALGLQVQGSYRNLLQIRSPVQQLLPLTRLPGVRFVRRPLDFFPQAIQSEGARLTGTAPWHQKGYRGQGAKVAIVDRGFAGYKKLQGTELPASVTTRSFVEGVPEVERFSSHGTAVAEILYDMAPDATFYYVNISTEVELADAVDWLVTEGVKVISFSLGVLAAPMDGSGVVDEIVDRARNQGILWVSAAGNYGSGHLRATFVDTNGDGWHEFAPGQQLLPLTIPADEVGVFLLTWNDWPASNHDYGIYLFWEGINGQLQLLGFSDSTQSGTQPPVEAILGFGLPKGQYYLSIKRHKSDRADVFHLYSLAQDLPQGTPYGSVVSPATARGAMSVGATNGFDQIQAYSSRGPTEDGRIKPEIVAPDTVTTATFGPIGFPGTSASTPHVAGAAALLLSAFPWMTANDLQWALEDRALKIGLGGKDNTFGAGRLQMGALPDTAPAPQSTPAPTETATRTPTPTSTRTPVSGTRTPGTSTATRTATAVPSASPTPAQPSPTGVAWPTNFSYLPVITRRLP